MAAPSSSASASASLSSSNPSVAVGERLAALEGVMRQLPPSVPIDYHHECVPKGLLKYALADRGHKSGACMRARGCWVVVGGGWLE